MVNSVGQLVVGANSLDCVSIFFAYTIAAIVAKQRIKPITVVKAVLQHLSFWREPRFYHIIRVGSSALCT